MNGQPDQLHLVRQWIAKADEDLKNAEYTLTLDEECPFGTICFHAQQCAEKYIKALLVFHAVLFPRTHDLVILFNSIPSQDQPNLSLDELAVINRYAVETRYPGDWEPISRQEANEAVGIARTVKDLVREHFPREVFLPEK